MQPNPPRRVDVRELRLSLHMSQPQFAEQFGLNLSTLRQWERGARYPTGLAQTLLAVIRHSPDAVKEAIRAAA